MSEPAAAKKSPEATALIPGKGAALPSAAPTVSDGAGATVNTAQTTAAEGMSENVTADAVQERIRRATEQVDTARLKEDPFIGSEILGRFKIESKIGEGGMGAVYKGMQTSVQRAVAIKVLLRNLVKQEKFVRRFQNEALAVSRLQHPNTIRIIDFGQVDESTLFIAMEFLDGQPLQRVLRKMGALPVKRVLHILSQTAQSLAEAHAKGIVHRDLKPDNLFICKVGEDDWFVKVLDFGVAKFTDPGAGELTQTHMILGTPKYMAPEQARGREVDHRSDLYSLGVIAYELLLGKAPFSGDAMTILYKQVHDTPTPMSERAPEIFVPPAIEKLVMALMAKDPEQRPQSADALRRVVDDFLRELPDDFESVIRRGEDGSTAIIDLPETLGVTAALSFGGATAALTGTATSAMPAPALPAWRRWAPLGAAALGLMGAAAWFALKPAPAVQDTAPAAPPQAAMFAPLALPHPAHNHVRVRIESKPAAAQVFRGTTLMGTAPLAMERPTGAKGVELRVVFPTGKEAPLSVTFNEDRTYVAALEESTPTQPQSPPDVPPKPDTTVAGTPPDATSGDPDNTGQTPPDAGEDKKPTGKRPGTQIKGRDPGKSDPGKSDPGKVDPGKVDPGKVDPGRVSPLK